MDFKYNIEDSDRSGIITFLLCFFLGDLGIHRFYVGKIKTGILWILTLGVFGFGNAIDIILIIFDRFKDDKGKKITFLKNNRFKFIIQILIVIMILMSLILRIKSIFIIFDIFN